MATVGYPPRFVRAPSAHDRFAAEQKAVSWAKRALCGYLVIIGLGLLAIWSEASWFRAIVDNIRAPANTGAVNVRSIPSSTFAMAQLLVLVELAVYIVLLNWQFRAAKTAQLLQLPAKRSPGLGVGGWFIPIVSLWFPYQAIRDCLPPEDPGRHVVSRMWLCFIAMTATDIAAGVLTIAGSPFGFVFAAIAVAFAAGFASSGAKAVQLIADAHRRLPYPVHPAPQ